MTPEKAAIDALIEYLSAAQLANVRVREGWPETDALGLQEGPVVAIFSVGRVQWDAITPELIASAAADTTAACLYRIAQGSLSIQISLFAAYKAQRDDVAGQIEPLLDNLFPASSGLILSTGYHAQSCRYELSSTSEQDENGSLTGEWRRDWILSAQLEQLREQLLPLQLEATTVLTSE